MQGHQWRWLCDVQPGDVVIEITARAAPWSDRIGVLIREYDRPVLDEVGVEFAKEHRWVIRTNEREFEWHNASFIRIPTTKHQRQLYKAWGERCVMANCRECAREQWHRGPDGKGWRQRLRGDLQRRSGIV